MDDELIKYYYQSNKNIFYKYTNTNNKINEKIFY